MSNGDDMTLAVASIAEKTPLLPSRSSNAHVERSDENKKDASVSVSSSAAAATFWNFVGFSFLFSSNPCCVLACMALATARLGTIGAYQSVVIYIFYTGSSITGATLFVKQYGAKKSIIAGMMLYCAYVGCFIIATTTTNTTTSNSTTATYWNDSIALFGAALGGTGGGILWTAQGVYFSHAAAAYHHQQQEQHEQQPNNLVNATSYLASIFACIYLAMEALMEIIPTILMDAGIVSWTTIFCVYTAIAITATICMMFVHDYHSPSKNNTILATPLSHDYSVANNHHEDDDDDNNKNNNSNWTQKVLATWNLLVQDDKMKYLIGVNASFGFAGAFLHSLVNGEIVRIVLQDDCSKYVGALTAWSAIVSSLMALAFHSIAKRVGGRGGQGVVQVMGCVAYLLVALPFIIVSDLTQWGWGTLMFIYAMYGCGRATFEGSLKAILADWFSHEKEGAYGNLVLQSGVTSILGFVVTYCTLPCWQNHIVNYYYYCIEYNDGTMHNILPLELVVVLTSIVAIYGYLKASHLYKAEQRARGLASIATMAS